MLNDGADERRCFSTRDCRDADRWQEMPSLSAQYSRMDLHQQRYIRTVHPSLLQQSSLISLKITQCVQLQTLPDDLGQLRQLQEVRKLCFVACGRFCFTPSFHLGSST